MIDEAGGWDRFQELLRRMSAVAAVGAITPVVGKVQGRDVDRTEQQSKPPGAHSPPSRIIGQHLWHDSPILGEEFLAVEPLVLGLLMVHENIEVVIAKHALRPA